MAIQTTIAIDAKNVKMHETGIFDIITKIKLPATTAADSQVIMTMPYAGRLTGCVLRVPATLGAGATVKMQKRDVDTGTAVDINVVSTAATAGIANGSTLLPIDFKAGDTIEMLTAGANVAAQATANVELDLFCQHG